MFDLATRPPSQAWEAIPLDGQGLSVWVWFRPPAAPDGVTFNLTADVFSAGPMTLRRLFSAIGSDGTGLFAASVFGHAYDAASIAGLIDQPLPAPVAGGDSQITLRFAAAAATGSTGERVEIHRIRTEWQVVVQIEANISLLRRKLADLTQRMQALNRDLNPDERFHADKKDQSDWFNARRGLRDMSLRVSKAIKEHDIGVTSNAGRRKHFEEVYEQFIIPQRPYAALEQLQRDFEAYRKIIATLQINMNTAATMASQEGEQKANEVLRRIKAAVRRGQRGQK